MIFVRNRLKKIKILDTLKKSWSGGEGDDKVYMGSGHRYPHFLFLPLLWRRKECEEGRRGFIRYGKEDGGHGRGHQERKRRYRRRDQKILQRGEGGSKKVSN